MQLYPTPIFNELDLITNFPKFPIFRISIFLNRGEGYFHFSEFYVRLVTI